MDTKWKSRTLLFGLLFLFTFGVSSLLVGLFEGHRYIEKSYFDTDQFYDEYNHFLMLLQQYELNVIPDEEIKKSITVSTEEIEEYRTRNGNLSDQIFNIKDTYDYRIKDAKDSGNQDIADVLISERDKEIEDITKVFNNEEYVIAKIKKEKEESVEDYFNQYKHNIVEFESYQSAYKYFLTNVKTGEVFTNMNIKSLDDFSDKGLLHIHQYNREAGFLSTQDGSVIWNDVEVKKSGLFEGKIGVVDRAGTIVTGQYENYGKQQMFFLIYVALGIISLLVSLYLFKKKSGLHRLFKENWNEMYNKLPIDVKFGLFIASLLATWMSLFIIGDTLHYSGHVYETIVGLFFITVVITLLIVAMVIQGNFLFTRYKDISYITHDWPKSLVYKLYIICKEAFLIKKLGTQFFILLLVVFGLGGITAACIVAPWFVIVLIPIVVVVAPFIFIMIKQLSYFNKIMIATGDIANGNLASDLPVKGKSTLANHSAHINQLRHGVKTSKQEQVKSDRLKTELVTNISHDLRTPLTSIISYTDLLKNPDLVEEDRRAYIDIIDRKADRLKVLIDDLFDVSKMASGNMELEKKEVDIVQLLQQSLAERDDTIQTSGLDFRVQKPDYPIIVTVDGQKIWRVFDNLLGNITKYSLEGTRVYISLRELENQIEIIFKNVTKYELSENVDELFERFKRGDASRNTDGSGLGLAIAKSIIDIHDGSLEIEVDGDLFKVIVKIPK
ncbi:GHKL domain-containing protein [Bacillus sp. BGMRC 2118]|nr:GHKL domain-containing protein [Bacillus sp. BGMRC 2118]